jgi:hypothetical protein
MPNDENTDTLPDTLPGLTVAEKKDALQLGALAKSVRASGKLPHFCINCGQTVSGQVALDSTDAKAKYCPIHGVKLRPDGSCPLEG